MSDILNILNKNRLEESLITTSNIVISKLDYKSKNIFQKFKFHVINGRFLNKDALADLIANRIDEHVNKSKNSSLDPHFYILAADAKNFKDKIKPNHPKIAEKLEQVFQRHYYQELLIDINNGSFSEELINNISQNQDVPENIRKHAENISVVIKMIEEKELDNIVMSVANEEFIIKGNYPKIDSRFIDLYNEAPIIRKKVEERNQKIHEIKDKINKAENWREILKLYSNQFLMTAHLKKYIEDKILIVFTNEINLYSLFTELDIFIKHSNFESFPDEVKECAKQTLNKYIDKVNDLSKNNFKSFEDYLIKLIGYLDVKSYPSPVRMVAQDKLITHISQISNNADLELYQIEDLIQCSNIKVSSDCINAIKNIINRKKFQLFSEENNNKDAQQAKELIGRNRLQKLASDVRKEQIDKEINNLNILISNLNRELEKEIENLNKNEELVSLKIARESLNEKHETNDEKDVVSKLKNISSALYKKAVRIVLNNPDNRINEIESRKIQLLDQIERNTQRKMEFAKERSDFILNERQNYFNEIKQIANNAEFTIFLKNFGDVEKSNSQLIRSLIGNIETDLIAELRSIAISTFIAKIDKGLFDEQIKNMCINKVNNNKLEMQSMDSLRMLQEDDRTGENLEKITTIVTDPRLINIIEKRKNELPAVLPLELIPTDDVEQRIKIEKDFNISNRSIEEDTIDLNLELIQLDLDAMTENS